MLIFHIVIPDNITKIGDIRRKKTNLTVVGKVELKRNEPTPWKKHAIAQISDETGKIWLSLWREQIGQVNVGDTILLTNAFIRTDKGRTTLNTWNEVILKINPDEIKTKKS